MLMFVRHHIFYLWDYAVFDAALAHFHNYQANVGPGSRGLTSAGSKG